MQTELFNEKPPLQMYLEGYIARELYEIQLYEEEIIRHPKSALTILYDEKIARVRRMQDYRERKFINNTQSK